LLHKFGPEVLKCYMKVYNKLSTRL